MDSQCGSSVGSRATIGGVGNINSTHVSARIESYEGGEKKCISDVRRTFCLFVTFDLLFVTLLWIIELNVCCSNTFALNIIHNVMFLTSLLCETDLAALHYV